MKTLIQTSLCVILTVLIGSCASRQKPPEDVEVITTNEELISTDGLELEKVQMPAGFKIEVFARVQNARSMSMSPNGTLFVGNRKKDKVYAVRDTNGDWKADEIHVIAEGLRMPNGVAFKDGSLYIAEVSRLLRFDDIEKQLANPPKPVTIYDDYPSDAHHGWKYIAFGPDGKLYVPVGAPCNICESKNELYASITRMDPDGSNREVYAHGVRNTVGFTWHPNTNEMWFTDNGRDWLGNDEPPCELNRVTTTGEHFGYPYCHGGYLKDPEFGDKYPCKDFRKPVQNLGPHVAPLGLKFNTGGMFPSSFNDKIFIAEHGSWNRDQEVGHTGYKITTVTHRNGEGIAYEDFAVGFLNQESNKGWARPVDILFMEDGSMLVSDDLGGTIFRISYAG
ncbi:MAG: sorbosone dehydrogenase family protein [Bacteroidota bacterium]